MFTLSINYGETETVLGDDYEAAYRAYGQACEAHPLKTVTLIEDEDTVIKEREVLE